MIALKVGPDLRMAVVATPGYLEGSSLITHPSDLTRHRCINYRMVGAGTAMEHQQGWLFPHGGTVGHQARTLDVEEQPHAVHEHMHELVSRGRMSR